MITESEKPNPDKVEPATPDPDPAPAAETVVDERSKALEVQLAAVTNERDGLKDRLMRALADMETRIGGGDFSKLVERLKTPSPRVLLYLLHALLVGGGADMTLAYLKSRDVDAQAAGKAIAKAFRALADERAGHPPAEEIVAAPGKFWPRRKSRLIKEASHGSDGSATR